MWILLLRTANNRTAFVCRLFHEDGSRALPDNLEMKENVNVSVNGAHLLSYIFGAKEFIGLVVTWSLVLTVDILLYLLVLPLFVPLSR